MSEEKCTNYEVCEKYDLYGGCISENDFTNSFCSKYQKQVITILSSIDEKLSALLKQEPDK